MAKLTTCSEIARLIGITRQAVSDARRKGELQEASVGQKVDVEHPTVRDYLRKHGVDDEAIGAFVGSTPERRGPGLEQDAPEFEAYADLTIRQILDIHGTEERFSNWLDSNKTFEQVIHQRLKNQELAGSLIDRELVRIHVFGALESLTQRLLRDFAKTSTRQNYAAAKNGTPVEESEALVRKALSDLLGPAKKKAAKALKDE